MPEDDEVNMTQKKALTKMQSELQVAVALAKCKKCGCMKQALEELKQTLPSLHTKTSVKLLATVDDFLKQLQQTEYSCLGCKYCYGAEVTNACIETFPQAAKPFSSSFNLEISHETWPSIVGEYFVVCDKSDSPVAVSTLASLELAEEIATAKPKGLCIVGKTETENIGIDKIVKNTIANPNIRFLIIAGKEPEGHRSGATLLALSKNGVDQDMRVINSPAIHPILANVSLNEVDAFRKQIKTVNLIGCEDISTICEKIVELASTKKKTCTCQECSTPAKPTEMITSPIIQAKKRLKIEIDKAGYFVIIPKAPDKVVVEHYSNSNKLQRTIEGKDSSSIFSTIIENGWVTQLSHAAYLGSELAKVELSLKLGYRYVQDQAQYHIKKRNRKETN